MSDYNPLIYVHSNPKDYAAPDGGGGGGRKIFDWFGDEHREVLSSNLEATYSELKEQFLSFPGLPGIVKVSLFEDAIAKSHRPNGLFVSADCRVVGVGMFGELFVSASPEGLSKLNDKIRSVKTKEGMANLSSIESMGVYSVSDKVSFPSVDKLFETLSSFGGHAKFKLFDYLEEEANGTAYGYLMDLISSFGNPFCKKLDYGNRLDVFKIRIKDKDHIKQLATFLGTKSLGCFAKFEILRSSSNPVRSTTASDIPDPDPQLNYPVVGVVDSGVSEGDTQLQKWVIKKHEFIAENDKKDTSHGSFVSGIIVNGNGLNHEDERFPTVSSKLIDVSIIEKGGVSEEHLMTALEEVISENPDVKVWNLSLSSKTPCDEAHFSDMAILLDKLQSEYDVSIVLAAGNYDREGYRGWPSDVHDGSDKITFPADSIRSITVGSTAHQSVANSRVQPEEPSPFSRRGPGPCFTPKPELSHYGGNCSEQGAYQQTGVLSVNGAGMVVEDIGTSYSTPTVSSILANLRQSLGENDSRTLSHALMIHSAALRTNSITADEFRYRGFGIPESPEKILGSINSRATMIFEVELVPGIEFYKDFPIPTCLRTAEGKTKGMFTATLVYDPPLDARFGAEYCRTNVDFSLGKYDLGKDGKYHHKGLIPLAPTDRAEMFEKSRIEHGFKWSPVKVYAKVFPQGVTAENWRIKVSVTTRKEYTLTEKQRAHIILTISDPSESLPVYQEFIQATQSVGWTTTPIQIQQQIKLRT